MARHRSPRFRLAWPGSDRGARRDRSRRRSRSPGSGRLARLGLLPLLMLTGCVGELTVLAALAFGMTLGAWVMAAGRDRRMLAEAEHLRRAIASGEHRGFEDTLRRELALAEAGEAVSLHRQWIARTQLAGLMVAEWRLEEAREIYRIDDDAKLGPYHKALSTFGRHELSVLTETPDEARLEAIRSDRDRYVRAMPRVIRGSFRRTWDALEGLCLVRMGRAREGAELLANGLSTLVYNPSLVVYLFHLGQAYEHIGERQLAATRYEEAAKAFPGTRLASEAQARLRALSPSGGEGSMFRAMLPEAPVASTSTALVAAGPAAAHDGGRERDEDET